MNTNAYNIFFEKVAGSPISYISNFFRKTAPIAGQAVKKPSSISKIMGIALPISFMGMEGMGAVKNLNSNIGRSAKSMPQTMNPWQTF